MQAAGIVGGPSGVDPTRELLAERGRRHESAYVEHLRGRGLAVEDLAGGGGVEATLDAMRRGVGVIVQAPLGSPDGRWSGTADGLQRVDAVAGSEAVLGGSWSYEAFETKLSRETRAGAVVQLGLYSIWLGALQGGMPRWCEIVAPGGASSPGAPRPFAFDRYRVAEIAAYVRRGQAQLEAALAEPTPATWEEALAQSYPEPCSHCEVCRWWKDCAEQRDRDDHLTLVAGLGRSHAVELRRVGLGTRRALARAQGEDGTGGLPQRPAHGSVATYVRLHHQARVQVQGIDEGRVLHELFDVAPEDLRLCELPEPSPGDLFLDLEGDVFVDGGGQEYLFGLCGADGLASYTGRWGLRRSDERAAFEATIDAVVAARQRDPNLHVFHFGAYEPAALGRLVGRHATRIDEVDALLRDGVLVDLHRVVKRSLFASVERYSLKELEPLLGFTRATTLVDARRALREVEAGLELEGVERIGEGAKRIVQAYNAEDCVATVALRAWLEGLRDGIERDHGIALPRPAPRTEGPSEKVTKASAAVAELVARLREGIDANGPHTAEHSARWLLANLLDFHRREEKVGWWEFFRLAALPEDEREDAREVVSGLTWIDARPDTGDTRVHRYRFVPQETSLRAGDPVLLPGGAPFGVVESIDVSRRELEIASKKDGAGLSWVFTWKRFNPGVKAAALQDFARDLLAANSPAWAAARALLLRDSPRLLTTPEAPSDFVARPGESAQAQAQRVVMTLDRSVLAIQGPPGTGKTHTGAEMIVALVRAGKRVGVTGMSHAVVRNLLTKVVECAAARELPCPVGAKVTTRRVGDDGVRESTDNKEVVGWLAGREVAVLGGTPWLWARPELRGSVDVLFVDEAGQLALADVLAVAAAGDSLVLLGDPQQLDQPRRALHPEGADVSALGHVLGGAATIEPTHGVFLDETWRLPPPICAFTSELFYDGRLRSRPGLEQRALIGAGAFDGAGMWFVPVEHSGCSVRSMVEVEAVVEIVRGLVGRARWRDMLGEVRELGVDDVMVIAPYNAQVAELSAGLCAAVPGFRGERVGTVDRFQGQQAAVVIWSVTSSSAEDAPRGVGFLYDGRRLNVGTSRATVCCVVVGTRAVFAVGGRTGEDVRRVGRWCAWAEAAGVVKL